MPTNTLTAPVFWPKSPKYWELEHGDYIIGLDMLPETLREKNDGKSSAVLVYRKDGQQLVYGGHAHGTLGTMTPEYFSFHETEEAALAHAKSGIENGYIRPANRR